ncbi:MAG: hypothetical protein ACYC2P_12050 [Paludibacteraceae bacterium]
MRSLFDAVNVAMIANPALDYQPLVREVNVELKAMKASLKKSGKVLPEISTDNGETNPEEAA